MLHRREQRELATWVLLKAIVFDQSHPDTAAVPKAFIDHLYRERRPPDQCWVWLTAWTAESPAHYLYQGLLLTPPVAQDKPTEPTAFCVTFTMGGLVLQVAGGTVARLDLGDIVYPQIDAPQIWPYRVGTITFAPRIILNARSLNAFATAIYDDLRARSGPDELGPAVQMPGV